MNWRVEFTSRAAKQLRKTPENIQKQARALVRAIEIGGPIQGKWPNYSKLARDRHHCHLSYRYVLVWEVKDKTIRLVEVTYVGTREKAPY